jgi:phosphatidylserine decarboxylase
MTVSNANRPVDNQYQRRNAWPMDPHLKDIQPGGGVIIRWEQAWGSVRRWWLKTFRKGYLARMESLRKGDFNPCPHPVLDPRDLKFHRNQGGYYWASEDDPFLWRDRLPFARAGLAELFVMGGGLAALSILSAWWASLLSGWLAVLVWLVAITMTAFCAIVVWFFRNPRRAIPNNPNAVISPADGLVVEIEELEHEEYIGGPAIKIGIFLSIFNVHINRAPVAARVIGLRYQPGKYLNALRPESARENEQVAIMLESANRFRPMIVRQITGAVARRIVCWLKPEDELKAGEQVGMIKLGSRTELVVPKEAQMQMRIKIGDRVKAGTTIMLEYPDQA